MANDSDSDAILCAMASKPDLVYQYGFLELQSLLKETCHGSTYVVVYSAYVDLKEIRRKFVS